MKAAKYLVLFILIASLLALSLVSCAWDDPGRPPVDRTPRPGDRQSYDLTATYGADQFHAQLTALADTRLVGSNP